VRLDNEAVDISRTIRMTEEYETVQNPDLSAIQGAVQWERGIGLSPVCRPRMSNASHHMLYGWLMNCNHLRLLYHASPPHPRPGGTRT